MNRRSNRWTLVAWTLMLAVTTPAYAADATAKPVRKPYTRNVAIVLYEGVETLDFAGPLEVFASAARFGASGSEPAFNVYTVSKTKAPLTSLGVLSVTPQYGIDDAPKPDLIVIPGGNSNSITDDPAFQAWVADRAKSAELALTVCTGAFSLGKAGMLDGLDVTTFYGAIDGLRAAAPKARVHDGRRFIDNGHIVTTAGVSAGMDGSLHVVARLLGRRVADRTAQYMEYRWTPEPYLVASYPLLNPALDANGRTFESAMIAFDSRQYAEAATGLRKVVAQDAAHHEAWFNLGMALLYTKDYKGSIDASLHSTAAPRHGGDGYYNAACGSARLGDTAHALEYLQKAADAGFSVASAASDPDLESVRTDPRWATFAARIK